MSRDLNTSTKRSHVICTDIDYKSNPYAAKQITPGTTPIAHPSGRGLGALRVLEV